MERKTPKVPQKQEDSKELRRPPDYGPWPPVGYVGYDKLRAAFLGAAEQTLRNWEAQGLLPPSQLIGPNRVGWPVDVARRAVEELPVKLAALERAARGTGARRADATSQVAA